nr:MAG TPA: hypothetical protein [Herelleviridae sp.]
MVTINENKIADAESILNNMQNVKPSVKVVKKDKGLFEKYESAEKIIITEDNKQLLLG